MAVGEKRSVVMGAEKAAPNGVATLGADGKLAENQRPDATGMGAANRTLSNLTDPQMALYNLGAGVRPNLLDNWYFVGGGKNGAFPVNQKGITSTGDVDKNVISIDRWKRAGNDGVFSLTAGGLLSDGSNATHIYQLLEPDLLYAKTVTFSAWTNLGVVFGTINIPTAEAWPSERQTLTAYEDDAVCLRVVLLAPEKIIQVQPEAKTALTLKAVKLEVGKTQTLAYKGPLGFWNLLDIPDYTTELLKCQRHMVIVNTHLAGNVNFPVNIGMAMSANNAFIPIELPVPMRTTPALSVSGQFCLGTGNGEVDTTLTFSTANDINCVLLNAAASGLTPGQAVYLRAKNDSTAKLILNANL